MSTESVASPTVPSHLTDDQLTDAVWRFARQERASTAELVAHLAEFDARRLHLAAGCPSLFAYCCQVLRLSEHATYNRIEAARAARRFPMIVSHLVDGSLNLATVRMLAPHLTPENHRQLLAEASGRGKRDVEELLARLDPRPDGPTVVRRLPTPPAHALVEKNLPGDETQPANGSSSGSPSAAVSNVTLVALRSRQPVVVLAPGRYEIRFTASAATREKLRAAQDLLRHAVPDGDTAEVIDRALSVLIEHLTKQKCGAGRPRSARDVAPGSRYISAVVRRSVWMRDGARCAFVSTDGRRCAARTFLEFHHIQPYASGGAGTVDNIALRCRAHNQHEGELAFGRRRTYRQQERGLRI
jgi:hypothetical protein